MVKWLKKKPLSYQNGYFKQANFNRRLIFKVVSTIHLIWGIEMLTQIGVNMHTTAIETIWRFMPSFMVLGWLFTFAGIAGFLAVSPFITRFRYKALFLTPQQFLLLWSAVGAVACMMQGHFADGTIRPRGFIIIDQMPIVAVAIFHTHALFYNYILKPFRFGE